MDQEKHPLQLLMKVLYIIIIALMSFHLWSIIIVVPSSVAVVASLSVVSVICLLLAVTAFVALGLLIFLLRKKASTTSTKEHHRQKEEIEATHNPAYQSLTVGQNVAYSISTHTAQQDSEYDYIT